MVRQILLHSMGNFECVDIATARGLAIFRGFRGLKAHRPYCAKHNQHAKYANARGSEACPPRNFEK